MFIFAISEQQLFVDRNGFPIPLPQQITATSAEEEDLASGGAGGPSIVDEALADIVLVRKQEMEEWRRKQEQLQHELNVNKRKVEMKLRETK